MRAVQVGSDSRFKGGRAGKTFQTRSLGDTQRSPILGGTEGPGCSSGTELRKSCFDFGTRTNAMRDNAMHAMQDNGHMVRMASMRLLAMPGNARHCRALPRGALVMR